MLPVVGSELQGKSGWFLIFAQSKKGSGSVGQVDVADEFGATPLLCAARRGATISSLYLSKRGACLKSRDKAGNDALGIALAGGHDQHAMEFASASVFEVFHGMSLDPGEDLTCYLIT